MRHTSTHSCRSSARTDSCPNTEYSNCDLAKSWILCKWGWRRHGRKYVCVSECLQVCSPMHVRAQVIVLVAAQQDARSWQGERGGCCCYGNSQAGLNLISLPLCLLELWEETRKEGCPETATAFKRTITTLSDKSLYSNQTNTGGTHKEEGTKGAHRTVITVDKIQ